VEVDVIELLPRLNTEPKLPAVVVQCIGELVDESSDLFFVGGIDLFPVEDDTTGLRIAQDRKHPLDETILSILRTVREILDRFRLPTVTGAIGQERHQGNAVAGGKFR